MKQQQDLLAIVDTLAPHFAGKKGTGEALFDKDGSPTDLVTRARDFPRWFHGQTERAREQVRQLEEAGLLVDRLGVDPEALAEQADSFLRRFGAAVGAPQSLTEARARRQQAYLRGIRMAKRLFRGEAAA